MAEQSLKLQTFNGVLSSVHPRNRRLSGETVGDWHYSDKTHHVRAIRSHSHTFLSLYRLPNSFIRPTLQSYS